jgi:hypothetical protein
MKCGYVILELDRNSGAKTDGIGSQNVYGFFSYAKSAMSKVQSKNPSKVETLPQKHP